MEYTTGLKNATAPDNDYIGPDDVFTCPTILPNYPNINQEQNAWRFPREEVVKAKGEHFRFFATFFH